jgi:hypothetical protein
MFLPGTPCGCCGSAPCQPCPRCAPECLTVTLSGFAHGTENCNECSFLDDTTFEMTRPPDPTLSVTASVPSATGSGAAVSVTTTRNATDGSYAVTGIKLTNGGFDYSLGDKLVFATNGCFVETPEASITIATTKPAATQMRLSTAGVFSFSTVAATYEQQASENDEPYWTIKSIGSPGPGAGYTEGQTVELLPAAFTPSGLEAGVVSSPPGTATIDRLVRLQPQLDGRVYKDDGNGDYLLFNFTYSQSVDEGGRLLFAIEQVTYFNSSQPGFSENSNVQFVKYDSSTKVLSDATATVSVDQEGRLTAITITDGGSYYRTLGAPESVTLQTGGVYYKPGVITSVTLQEGGKIYGPVSCNYLSDPLCTVCPETLGHELRASLSLGASEHVFKVFDRRYTGNPFVPFVDTQIYNATRSAVDEDGAAIQCTKLTFEPEHASKQYSCMTNGTVTIAEGQCEDSSQSGCDLPDQITLTLSGMGGMYVWSSRNSGVPGMQPCPDPEGGTYERDGQQWPNFVPYTPFCGQCGKTYTMLLRGGGVNAGLSGWTGSLVQQDCTVVLDRLEGCGIEYTGFMPLPPSESGFSGNFTSVSCGGGLDVSVSVSIVPVGLATTVTIAAPTNAGFAATAEVTEVDGEGGVTGITITNPGEGYAREIFTRTQPEMNVTLSGGTGSGATLTATLTQSGSGESATWGVQSVAVTNGGTGYAGNEAVVFTPEEGATTDYPASAYIVTGRVEPTVTASVSGGSGASLSVALGQSTDWNGLDIWSVSSVTVNNGGTGYTDGESVTFTVTDGTQVYGASATISTVRSQPGVTASLPSSGGSGAVLAPSLSASGDSWTVSSVAITNGGSGYSQWDEVLISTGDIEASGSYIYVSSVDGTGAITGIGISNGGSYYRDTGVISSVNFPWYGGGGEYYKSTGIIESVVVWEPGSYYLSESTGTADVDEPAVFIISLVGSGAEATATVDGEVGSATFGQVTSISVTQSGSDYKTSGTGWGLTINSPVGHLATLTGNEVPPTPDPEDSLDCGHFWNKREPYQNRVSLNPCPSELLSKDYSMAWGGSSPFGDPYGDGLEGAEWCHTIQSNGNHDVTFFDFGNGPIKCTIAPS